MALKVIGAGVMRTGTTSLKIALEQLLGGKCHHMLEVVADHSQMPRWIEAIDGENRDWEDLLSGYVAAVDWPAAAFWPELAEAYPDALIVLSVRSPESWYKSLSNTIIPQWDSPPPPAKVWLSKLGELLHERFSYEYHDPTAMMEAFERNNQAVRDAIPPERLLEWTAKDGWEPICERLGIEVPNIPFPVANTTEEFASRAKW